MRCAAAFVVIVFLASCHTYEDDVAMFCRAKDESALGPDASLAMLAQWITERARSAEFRDVFKNVGYAATGKQAVDEIDAAVQRAGVTSCPTLDWLKLRLSR